MSHIELRDQRSGGRGTVAGRQRHRHRLRPTLMVLEDRRLLSTFTVTNTSGSPSTPGSLPYEVARAEADNHANTINFGPLFNTPQTINLIGPPNALGSLLDLSDTTGKQTITGPSVGVTVNGGGLGRVFEVDAGVTASISGMTITGGSTADNGGGLANYGGAITLTACTVNGNSANGNGGGLFNGAGTATLTNCSVSGNSAFEGGGLANSATATLTNCTVTDNSCSSFYGEGGGLDNDGTATLE